MVKIEGLAHLENSAVSHRTAFFLGETSCIYQNGTSLVTKWSLQRSFQKVEILHEPRPSLSTCCTSLIGKFDDGPGLRMLCDMPTAVLSCLLQDTASLVVECVLVSQAGLWRSHRYCNSSGRPLNVRGFGSRQRGVFVSRSPRPS